MRRRPISTGGAGFTGRGVSASSVGLSHSRPESGSSVASASHTMIASMLGSLMVQTHSTPSRIEVAVST
ncbi:hypothetical protein [Nonomuraea sp. NEAU-A123]|uniref:hypothetical protein n=1 Tax=Nonomuraea sp. NEAU-A123 TaxID=2839649 RepID=UPI001BE458DA|nr:hypothetical protein [Nonomuraea sp. NEAU-A123]MBT2227847.1 hypothetical protein [Nonomuraea sp. NEAU-A123]